MVGQISPKDCSRSVLVRFKSKTQLIPSHCTRTKSNSFYTNTKSSTQQCKIHSAQLCKQKIIVYLEFCIQ